MARTTLLTSALALTLATAPAAVLAQDNASESGTTRAQDLTCAQLTAMDTATVPGVLYFISGYGAGQQDGSGMAADGGMEESDEANGQSDAPQESGNAAQQAEAQSGGASGNAPDGETGAMGDGNLARVAGFFEIPVERLVLACQDAPDQRVSDMISQDAQNYADDVSADDAEAPGGNNSVEEGDQSQSMDSEETDANQQAEPEVEESTPEQGAQDNAGQDSGDSMAPNTQAEPEVEESTPEQAEDDNAN